MEGGKGSVRKGRNKELRAKHGGQSRITPVNSSSTASEVFSPFQTVLLQCSDLCQLKDAILEKSAKLQRELNGHNQSDRDELFRQLEVHIFVNPNHYCRL